MSKSGKCKKYFLGGLALLVVGFSILIVFSAVIRSLLELYNIFKILSRVFKKFKLAEGKAT